MCLTLRGWHFHHKQFLSGGSCGMREYSIQGFSKRYMPLFPTNPQSDLKSCCLGIEIPRLKSHHWQLFPVGY